MEETHTRSSRLSVIGKNIWLHSWKEDKTTADIAAVNRKAMMQQFRKWVKAKQLRRKQIRDTYTGIEEKDEEDEDEDKVLAEKLKEEAREHKWRKKLGALQNESGLVWDLDKVAQANVRYIHLPHSIVCAHCSPMGGSREPHNMCGESQHLAAHIMLVL